MSLGSIVLNLGGKLVDVAKEKFFGGGGDDDDKDARYAKAMEEGFLRKEARDVARDEALFRWKQAHARQKEGARITAGNTQRTTAKLQETKYLDDIYQKMQKYGINVEEVLDYIVAQQKRQSNSHTAVADLDAKYTVADPDNRIT